MFFVRFFRNRKVTRTLRIGLIMIGVILLCWLFFLYTEQKTVLAEKEEIISSNAKKLEESQQELKESQKQLQQFEEMIEKQQEKLESLNTTTESLQKSNKEKDSVINSLNESIKSLKGDINRISKEVKSIKVSKASAKEKQEPSKQEPVLASRSDRTPIKEIHMEATGYTAYCEGCSGVTASGFNLRENPGAKVIAVDPNVIPLGTKVHVEGYGYAVASDTGGAIKGHKIDLFFPKKAQALNWGRKTVRVKILK